MSRDRTQEALDRDPVQVLHVDRRTAIDSAVLRPEPDLGGLRCISQQWSQLFRSRSAVAISSRSIIRSSSTVDPRIGRLTDRSWQPAVTGRSSPPCGRRGALAHHPSTAARVPVPPARWQGPVPHAASMSARRRVGSASRRLPEDRRRLRRRRGVAAAWHPHGHTPRAEAAKCRPALRQPLARQPAGWASGPRGPAAPSSRGDVDLRPGASTTLPGQSCPQ
jgi:hypothetical protein